MNFPGCLNALAHLNHINCRIMIIVGLLVTSMTSIIPMQCHGIRKIASLERTKTLAQFLMFSNVKEVTCNTLERRISKRVKQKK